MAELIIGILLIILIGFTCITTALILIKLFGSD